MKSLNSFDVSAETDKRGKPFQSLAEQEEGRIHIIFLP